MPKVQRYLPTTSHMNTGHAYTHGEPFIKYNDSYKNCIIYVKCEYELTYIYFVVRSIIDSISAVTVDSLSSARLLPQALSNTNTVTIVIGADGSHLDLTGRSYSGTQVNLVGLQTALISPNEISDSTHDVVLDLLPGAIVKPQVISSTLYKFDFSGLEGKYFEFKESIKSLHKTILSKPTGVRITHKNTLHSLNNVRGVNRKASVAAHGYIADVLDDTSVVAGQGVPGKYEELIDSIDSLKVTNPLPSYLTLEGLSNVKNYVDVSNNKPIYHEISEVSDSNSQVNVRASESKIRQVHTVAQTLNNARLATIEFANGIVEDIVNMLHFVRLSVEQLEADWLNPVKNGTNLYIRQAWLIDQEESNLNIDYVTWLYPIQEDNNLHIQQVYDDVVVYENNAHIDTNGIWFEPVRTGSNLYIRQAESMEGSD